MRFEIFPLRYFPDHEIVLFQNNANMPVQKGDMDITVINHWKQS